MKYEVANILDLAAKLIQTSGLMKSDGKSPKGLCALQAISEAGFDLKKNAWSDARGALIAWLRQDFDFPPDVQQSFAIIAWNNAPERTAAQVVKALRGAAEMIRGQS